MYQLNKGIILLTNQCNLNCPYCFENHDPEYMTYETAKDILDYFHKADKSFAHFTFFGGEPMLCFDKIIVPLVEYSKTLEKPTSFAMTTNGTLLTKEKIDYLHENDVPFMLSMDGDKETQDRNRPLKGTKSCYEAIMSILPYLLETNPNQAVRATIVPATVDRLFENFMFFASLGIQDFFAIPDMFQKWDDEHKKIYAEQMKLYEEYCVREFKAGKMPFIVRDVFRDGISLLYNINKTDERRTYTRCLECNQCGMGLYNKASIDVHGDCYGCHHIAPLTRDSVWYLGNIYDGVDEERVAALNALYKRLECGNENCKNCPLDKVCFGGCKSNNYMIMGDVNKVPDMYCFFSRLVADTAYRLLVQLHDNELFKKACGLW